MIEGEGPTGHEPFPQDNGGEVRQMRTLDWYIDAYVNERRQRGELSTGSVEDYRIRLRSLSVSFGRRSLSMFSERAIERWLESIGTMRAGSRKAYLSTVRLFCHWMTRRSYIAKDPTLEISSIAQPRSVPRALPAADVARLIAARPDSRSQVVLWLMVGTGLRCIEVSRLDVSDYDAIAGTILVRGKAGHERVLPVPAVLALAMKRYLDENGRQQGPLIRTDDSTGRRVRTETISRLVGTWMIEAGVKRRRGDGISAHSLRHTAASDVLDVCGDLRIVQAMLGHANIATTSRYLRRASLGQMRDAMEGRTYPGETAA